jgi:hypothetical protein
LHQTPMVWGSGQGCYIWRRISGDLLHCCSVTELDQAAALLQRHTGHSAGTELDTEIDLNSLFGSF